MKKYDTAFIKEYIEGRKDEIESVCCGMKEDWSWTAETVFRDGEFEPSFKWDSKSINVAGISGSTWATPIMEVSFKDGRTEIVDCFFDDGNVAPANQIAQQMAFARMSGGRPIM